MVKSMTPPEVTLMTAEEIGKIQEILGARLRKSGLLIEPVQWVLEHQGDALAVEMVAAVCRRVGAVSDMIVRHVTVDRTRTPQAVLDATGRRQYTDNGVVKTMPRGDGKEVDVYLFPVRHYISDDDLEKEFERRILIPADPYSLAAVNQDDPAFADDHPNGTHWKDSRGEWCYAAFDADFGQWGGGRYVCVRHLGGRNRSCWFAGLRKS